MEFPELRRVAEALTTDSAATHVRNQLVHLYEQHVREWNSFSALKHLQQHSPIPVSTCVV
jgi:hypothetical protein